MNDVEVVKFMPIQVILIHSSVKVTIEHTTYLILYDLGGSWRKVVIDLWIFPYSPVWKNNSKIAIIHQRLILMTTGHQSPNNVIQIRIVRNSNGFICAIIIGIVI